ncbi:MAG: hypothetical protein HS099_24615 [Ardenticatenaceae bacterium]|nr:hypothetical protein [Ardenticatenaceae bacterium]
MNALGKTAVPLTAVLFGRWCGRYGRDTVGCRGVRPYKRSTLGKRAVPPTAVLFCVMVGTAVTRLVVGEYGRIKGTH